MFRRLLPSIEPLHAMFDHCINARVYVNLKILL